MNMRRYFCGLTILMCACLCVTGCREQADLEVTGGRFDITLQDGSSAQPTRVRPYEVTGEMKKQFVLHIADETDRSWFSGTMEQYEKASPALKPGNFALSAYLGDNLPLALDAPYYVADNTTASIRAGQVTAVTLQCKVGNSMASFAFADPDAAATLLSQYTIESRVGSTTVSCTVDDGHNPYFSAGSTVDFYLKGSTAAGKAVDYKFASIANAQRQKNYKYTLQLGGVQEGGAILGITVSTVVESISLSDVIPQEWLPKAKITAAGFDETGHLDYYETEQVRPQVSYQAVKATEDMEFTFDFHDQNIQSLSGTYLLSELSDDCRQALANAGLVLPKLGETAGVIDLTAFLAQLTCADDGAAVTNNISMRVKANHRWSDTQAYSISTHSPEFSITVDERESWSKEFSVHELQVTKGDAQTLKSKVVYQYSADNGHTWTDCRDGMGQKLASHPVQKQYQVRATYRRKVVSNVESVTLETPTQMPNSDMEDWYYANAARSINTYFPWNENGTSFWNTNNDYTTRYRSKVNLLYAGANPYNSFPAVSYVVGGHSGLRAAELRNTGSGRGNTIANDVKDFNKVAGELFTGDVAVSTGGTDALPSGDHYTIDTNGRAFASRPTSMHFWYKYAPLKSDTWRAKLVLMDAAHKVITEKELTASNSVSDWQEANVNLDFTDGTLYSKCAYIYVVFSSTVNAGANMPWERKDGYQLWEGDQLVNKNETRSFIGSILTIDDISLVYDK